MTKKVFNLMLVVILSLFSFLTSCTKDDEDDVVETTQNTTPTDSEEGKEEETKSFKATVDGVVFNYSTLMAMDQFGSKTITASMGTTASLIIILPSDDLSIGKHSLDSYDYEGRYMTGGTSAYYSTSGEVNISKYNKETGRVEGTFYFTAKDYMTDSEVSITNGEFKVNF